MCPFNQRTIASASNIHILSKNETDLTAIAPVDAS